MKKILFGFCLIFLAAFAQAQNGLESITVERYYVANAADHAGSPGQALPEGAVTYRIYADMAPTYKFALAYGSPTHTLLMTTTTHFYNNSDFGNTTPGFSATNAKKNTVMLDSWLTTGGACAGYLGVPKSEDNGVGNFVNTNGLLAGTNPLAGIPLTTQDGMLAGTVPGMITLGIDNEILVFGDGSADGNIFTTINGGWSCLAGSVGPNPNNKVLIAQITTDGIFHFELNIQLTTAAATAERFVVSNPLLSNNEYVIPSLVQTFYPTLQAPTVSITAPLNNANIVAGAPITFTATASDIDGTVSQVEFFAGAASLGLGTFSAGSYALVLAAGLPEQLLPYSITAKATDNDNQVTTSAAVNINVGNAPPVVTSFTKSAPANGANYVAGDDVTLNATATDSDGTVASIQFFDGATALGTPVAGATASYVYSGVIAGLHNLIAKAIDNGGKAGTAALSLQVDQNVAPSVTITAPANNAHPALNAPLTLTATATDTDGSIASVQFFNGAASLGNGTEAAGVYSLTFTPAVQGPVTFTARATDNKGGVTTSAPVNVVITDFNVAYTFTEVKQVCSIETVCMPITTVSPVSNVNGYNFTVKYDKTKVVPTGNITVSNDLVTAVLPVGHNAEYITDYNTTIDAAAGLINIGIFFNSNGGVNAAFNGSGDVCCVEFNKTAGFLSSDTAVFSFTEIIESYKTLPAATKTGSDGKFITYKEDKLYGSLKFWSDLSPIGYAVTTPPAVGYLITNINGCGNVGTAVQPDLLGNFTYSILNGTSLDIKRDIAPATNVHAVISAQDAYLTALVSVKGSASIGWTPSIYQMIAMDVNRDGLVTAGDATQINQRAVTLIPEFSQVGALGKDWSFIGNSTLASDLHYLISTSFPEDNGVGYSKYRVPVVAVCQAVPVTDPNGCPVIMNENYIGVLLGDVNATYETLAHDGGIKNATDVTSEIVIDLSQAVNNNGDISIPVSLTTTEFVNSFDFDVLINDMTASVKSVDSQYGINLSWNYIPSETRLSVAAFSLSSIPQQNTASLTLTLTGVNAVTSSDFNGTLALINGSPATLKVIDANTGIVGNTNDNKVQVYPNPTSDKLNVEVSSDAKVQLLDLNGKQVVAEQNVNANQKQTIDVSTLAAGVYMIKIYNAKFVKMQKVVIKK